MDKATLKNSLCNCEECSSGSFVLNEKERDATLREVTICDIPIGALIIKMEDAEFNGFLKPNKQWGYNKHSECVIVTDNKMIFIEMKSQYKVNEKLKDECWKKFTSDCCVINYVDDVFLRMLKKNHFFDTKETHFVLLYQTLSMAKTPIVAGSLSSNLTPDTFRLIPVVNGGTISFNRTI